MPVANSMLQPSESYVTAGSVNSKSVFETFSRKVPARFTSAEPDFWAAPALAVPATLDATEQAASDHRHGERERLPLVHRTPFRNPVAGYVDRST